MKFLTKTKWLFAIAITTTATLTAKAKLNVVATTPDFGVLAETIGGKKVSVLTLARPTEDPHFVDAKPSYILKLNRADVLIDGGADLEIGWLPPLIQGARNPKITTGQPGRVSAAKGIQLMEVPATLDRSMGDIHAAGNPHYMTDPANARIVAQEIADAFCAVDSSSCDDYRANLKKFTDELDVKMVEWKKTLTPYAGKEIVAYHDTWPYFGREFGFKIDQFLEPKPGIPPTPAHLAEVISKMKADNIHVVMVEPYQNRKTAETVAGNTDAVVVDMTQYPGGVKGTDDDYIKLMDYLVNTLAKAFASKS